MEDIIITYWPQLTSLVIVIVMFAKMRTEIDILKEKVKTLFDLGNSK